MKHKINKFYKDFKIFFVLVIVALTVKSSLVEIYAVPTGSMEDEILVGDLMIGNKFTYGMRTPNWIGIPYTRYGFYIPSFRLPKFKDIKNGDVTMFEFPRDPFQKYVKRCIGLGGDSISIKNGNIFINKIKMPFPKNAKYVTFSEADLDGDGSIVDTLKNGKLRFDIGDSQKKNIDNQMRYNVAIHKIMNFLNNGNASIHEKFGKKDVILLNEDYQLNPYKKDFFHNDKNNDGIASIQTQFINNQVYPYFSGNNDNMNEFVVPFKGMRINFSEWFDQHNEWISLVTLLVQDGNKVTIDDYSYVMEDPESIAQISGILWYKLFPNDEKRNKNYHNIKGNLKIENKLKKIDNPWYLYDNPIFLSQNRFNQMKSIDLNQDNEINDLDLVNSNIWNSFIKSHNPNDLDDILNNQYNGDQIFFVLEYFKKYADDYIQKNLKINGLSLNELKEYEVKNNYYMFVGDNRDNSYDSRVWGFVPEYQILGTPLLSLLNITKFKLRFKTIK